MIDFLLIICALVVIAGSMDIARSEAQRAQLWLSGIERAALAVLVGIGILGGCTVLFLAIFL